MSNPRNHRKLIAYEGRPGMVVNIETGEIIDLSRLRWHEQAMSPRKTYSHYPVVSRRIRRSSVIGYLAPSMRWKL